MLIWKTIGGFAACLILIALGAYGYVLGGWFTPKHSVEVHTERMSPGFALTLPAEGNSPYPVAVLMPGCLGTRSHHHIWAEYIQTLGWATLLIDSFEPRGISEIADLEAVCEGGRPWGFERAADIISGIHYLEQREKIDTDRIALFGWSNGAWAVMDALSFGRKSAPTNLSGFDKEWASGVRVAGLFYPYCGFGSRSRSRGWATRPDTLLFVAGRDENVSASECIETAESLRDEGVQIETIRLETATHWFDNPRDFELLPHEYDSIAVELVGERIQELLKTGEHTKLKTTELTLEQ